MPGAPLVASLLLAAMTFAPSSMFHVSVIFLLDALHLPDFSSFLSHPKLEVGVTG